MDVPLTKILSSVNPILHDFIVNNTQAPIPPSPSEVISPFEAALVKAGWEKDDSDDGF